MILTKSREWWIAKAKAEGDSEVGCGLDTSPRPGTLVRRARHFEDEEMAALFFWVADQLVIATPGNIARYIGSPSFWDLIAWASSTLVNAFERFMVMGAFEREARVRRWHDALEPGEMTFLPPEDREVARERYRRYRAGEAVYE